MRKPKYNIAELQADIDILKGKCHEMIVDEYVEVSAPTEADDDLPKGFIGRLLRNQREHAYEWLEKAVSSLDSAIHYLENYESLRE